MPTRTAPAPTRVASPSAPTKPDVRPELDEPGDHDRMAHIVYPAEAVTRALVEGSAVTALCGKKWVPTRDPKRYPVCPTCKEVKQRLTGR